MSTKIKAQNIHTLYNPYLGENETRVLIALIDMVMNPRIMIEIGCQQGRTAKVVLDNVPSLHTYIGIDIPFGKHTTLACQRSEVPYSAGLKVANDVRFALAIRERGSLDFEPRDLEPCDIMFIDGDHSAQAVLHDSLLAQALVRIGGIIIWHDYGNPAVEVTPVLDLLHAREGWPIHHVEGTWLAYRRVYQQSLCGQH